MTPSANCPQCAAPLPPGATKCGYCGFLTPWGATFAAVNERAAAVRAEQAEKQRIAKAESTARTGMILALVGLPICCAPLSLVGGVMGIRGARLAKSAGRSFPVTSIIAIIAALISTSGFITAIVMYKLDSNARDQRITDVNERLKGKREAEVIEATVACDIAEEHLARIGYKDNHFGLDHVKCDGPLAIQDRRASLPGVHFSFNKGETQTVTACLERRSRWYVMKLLDSGSCADLPPPSAYTPPAAKLSEDEARADENKARAAMEEAVQGATVKAFVAELGKIKSHAASVPGAEHACSRSDLLAHVRNKGRAKVSTIDFDLLDMSRDGKASKDWRFLSSELIRDILDEKRSTAERARKIDELRADTGKLLVVYKADVKHWPVVTSKSSIIGKDLKYDGGVFEGWLFVYDLGTGERPCQTKISFESSDAVSFRKSRFASEKKRAQDAIEEDFQEQFETQATEAIKRAAPDLRLGYKVIE